MTVAVGGPESRHAQRMDDDEVPAMKAPRWEWALRASLLAMTQYLKRYKPKNGLHKRAIVATPSTAAPALPWLLDSRDLNNSLTRARGQAYARQQHHRQREAVPKSTIAGDGPTRHQHVLSGPTNLQPAEPVGRVPGLASTPELAEPFASTRECATTPAPGERAEINLGLVTAPGLATKRAIDPASKPSRLMLKEQRQQQRESSVRPCRRAR